MFSLISNLIYKARLAAFSLAFTILAAFLSSFVPFVPQCQAVEAFKAIDAENFGVHAVVGVISGSLKAMLSSAFCLVETRVVRARLTIADFIVNIIRSLLSYFISLIPSTIVEVSITVVVERDARSMFFLLSDIFRAVLLRTLPAAFLAVFTYPGSAGSSPPTGPSTTPSTRHRSIRHRRRVRPQPVEVSTDLLVEVPLLLDLTFASEDLDLDVPATTDFHSPLPPTVNVHQDTALVPIDDSAVDSSLGTLASSVNADADFTPSWFDLVVADETAATEPDSKEDKAEDIVLAISEIEDFVPIAESSVVVVEEPAIVSTTVKNEFIPAEVPAIKDVISVSPVVSSSTLSVSAAVFAPRISCASSSSATVKPLDPSVSAFVPSRVAHPNTLDISAKPFVPSPSNSSSHDTSCEVSTSSSTSVDIENNAPADMESKIKSLLASVKAKANSTAPCAPPKPAASTPQASSVSRNRKNKENIISSTSKNVKSGIVPLTSSSRINIPQPTAPTSSASTPAPSDVTLPTPVKKVRVPRPEGFSRKQWSKHLAAEHDKRRAAEAAAAVSKLSASKGS